MGILEQCLQGERYNGDEGEERDEKRERQRCEGEDIYIWREKERDEHMSQREQKQQTEIKGHPAMGEETERKVERGEEEKKREKEETGRENPAA